MIIIRDHPGFLECCAKLRSQSSIVLDTETSGLKCWAGDKLCGVGIYMQGQGYYLPFRHKIYNPDHPLFTLLQDNGVDDPNLPLSWLPELWGALRRVGMIIGHNIKFDMAILSQDGYTPPEGPDLPQRMADTISGLRLWHKDKDPDMTLEAGVKDLLGGDLFSWKKSFKQYLEDRGISGHYDQAEVDVLAAYCVTDCENTWKLWQALHEFADKTQQADVLSVETDVVTVLTHVERNGMYLDLEYIDWAIGRCDTACEGLIGKIEELTGMRINPWKVQDVTSAMAVVGQRVIRKTEKTGQPSWTDDVLQRVDNELSRLILDWRTVHKMKTTFFEPYSVNRSGVVHPSFKPWGTVTGRFSCSDPNLQQVSKPFDWSVTSIPDFDVQVRRMFIAPPGYRFLLVDFRQMEMIGFADYLNDRVLREKLNTGTVDYHEMIRQLILDATSIELVRKEAKPISLGLIYGMGKEKFAARLERSPEEAMALKNAFFMALPSAQPFVKKVYQLIESRGYIFNRFGRRYYVPADRAYAGVNYLVQGTCADIIKRALVRLYKRFQAEGWLTRLVLQMHDEFGFYVHDSEWAQAVRAIIEIMEDVPILKTRFFVDVSMGLPSWADKVKVCKVCFRWEGCDCGDNKKAELAGVLHGHAAGDQEQGDLPQAPGWGVDSGPAQQPDIHGV